MIRERAGICASVVMVDDDPAALRDTSAMLAADHIDVVTTVADIADLLIAVEEHAPRVCVVPAAMGEAAFDACRTIRRLHPGTRVIITAGWAAEAPLRAAVQAGAAGYVVHNGREDHLSAAVRAVARGLTVFPGGLAAEYLPELREAQRWAAARPLENGGVESAVKDRILFGPRFAHHFWRRLGSGVTPAAAWHATRLRMREYTI